MSALIVDLATPLHLLVLIGGGEFSFGETREIDEFLVERMPADRRTVAFLPTASGSAEYAQHLGAYLKQIDSGLTTINVPIYRGRDSRRPKNLELLRSAGLVYLGGGVANSVVDTIASSPAERALRDAAADGAVVAAIGAAASCFGVRTRDMRGGSVLSGLAWLPGAVVETAFDPANDSGLRRLMSLPEVRVGLGIPPGTALAVFDSGHTQIVGRGSVAVFRKP